MTEVEITAVVAELKEAATYDTESAHAFADEILCRALVKAIGAKAEPILEAYARVPKWYA